MREVVPDQARWVFYELGLQYPNSCMKDSLVKKSTASSREDSLHHLSSQLRRAHTGKSTEERLVTTEVASCNDDDEATPPGSRESSRGERPHRERRAFRSLNGDRGGGGI